MVTKHARALAGAFDEFEWSRDSKVGKNCCWLSSCMLPSSMPAASLLALCVDHSIKVLTNKLKQDGSKEFWRNTFVAREDGAYSTLVCEQLSHAIRPVSYVASRAIISHQVLP